MIDINQTEHFRRWLHKLKDQSNERPNDYY